jgi:hypothetical protein
MLKHLRKKQPTPHTPVTMSLEEELAIVADHEQFMGPEKPRYRQPESKRARLITVVKRVAFLFE